MKTLIEEQGEAREDHPEKTRERCRVLLVEDDTDDRNFEKKELEAMDGVEEVVCFANGTELLDYMRGRGFQDRTVMCMTPTVIVADLYMPGSSGFDVLQEIKGDTFLEEIPVVIISSAPSPQNMHMVEALKADAFVRKPFKAQKIREILDKGWRWPTTEMWMS